MISKMHKIAALVVALILGLSCNLPRGVSRVAAPNPTQPQSSQPGEAFPAAPAVPAVPAALQGGITARAGYDQALPKALEWRSTAVLAEVSETPVDLEGKSTSWAYYFTDDLLQSPEDRSQGFVVIVGEDGVRETRLGTINIGENYLQADINDWQVDADQALAACEGAGGSALRAAYPAITLGAWLKMYDYQVPFEMPQPTSKNVSWIIVYHEPALGPVMTCEVDGSRGSVFRLSIDATDDPPVEAITARAGFQMALSKAQEWNLAATLLSASVDFLTDEDAPPFDGMAKYWRYEFIVLPAPADSDYQPAYFVSVSSAGLMNFRAGFTYASYVAYGSQADWVIDSDEAFIVSEANGGKAFRDLHSDAKFRMELVFGFNPVDELNTSKNVAWRTEYSSEREDAELYLQIDAASGELVSTYP